MTSTLERVKPIVSQGIQFYVSTDGKNAGLSQVGLAALVGMSETRIRVILKSILFRRGLLEEGHMTRPLNAKSLAVADFVNEHCTADVYLPLTSNQQARVVNASIAAQVISYYSNHVEDPSQVARVSCQKFVEQGILNWIKEITGFSDPSETSLLQASIDKLVSVTTNLTERLNEIETTTAGYRMTVVTMPGLQKWMDSVPTQAPLTLEAAEEVLTLSEYLRDVKKVSFDRSKMTSFSMKVATMFQTMAGEPAKKQVIGDKCKSLTPPMNAYARKHFPLLDLAFEQVFG
jgi:hypothetical protein